MGLLCALKKAVYVTNVEQIMALSTCYVCVSCYKSGNEFIYV